MTEKPSTKGIPAWYHMNYCHMLETAREAGYALALHGSLQRDLDLVAVPWTSEAVTAEALIEKFVSENGLIKIEPQGKEQPHGRKSYSLGMGGDLYADISVMPLLTRPTPQPSSEYVKALESVAEFANNLWWSIEGEAAGIENDLEAQRVNLKKALEDLNALKSHPTPAKVGP